MFKKDKMILQRLGLIPTDDDKVVTGHWGTAPFTYRQGRLTVQSGELRYPLRHVPDILASTVRVIDFHGSVALPTDSSYLLADCQQLQAIQGITHWDMSSVRSLAYLFLDDTHLYHADLASLDTHQLVDMHGMFQDTGFRTIDVSDWDFSHVTDMADMFRANPYLTRIDIHAADTGQVRDFTRFIYQNPALQDIDVRQMDTHSVRSMNRMFAHNDDITTIDIAGFCTDQVDDMECMFSTCPRLKNIAHLMDLSNDHHSKMKFMFTCDNELDNILTLDDEQFYGHSDESFDGIFD